VRRSPQGIMEQIATLDAEIAEVLENIKSLLNGASVMSRKIEVLSREVRLTGVNDQDYVCLTDIAATRTRKPVTTSFAIGCATATPSSFSASGNRSTTCNLIPSNSTGLEKLQA
jgi:hypothetical protein